MIFDSRAVRIRIPQEGPRVRLDELMTFAGLILWVLQAYIDDSGFGTIFGTELGKLIRYFCLFLFLARILLSDMHLAARAVSLAAGAFCFFMMIQQMAGAGITFLQLFVMMMAVKDISFKRICKVMFWACLVSYLGVLVCDRIGLIWQPPLIDGSRVRDYMGFRFVSFPSIYIFNLFFCGAYAYTDLPALAEEKQLRGERVQRLPLWSLAVLEGINVLVYVRTNTNIPFLITSFFVLLYLICFYGGIDLFPNHALMRLLAGLCYPVLAFFAYEVVSHYNSNSKLWLKIDDKLTHFRIRHAAEGLKSYGIHPFGQVVYQNGDLQSPNYFYIDSAYMKVLINYGLVFAIILFGVYAMISVAAVKNGDTVLCIWMVCIAGYSLMNNVLLDPEQCCTLFAFWHALEVWRRKKTPGIVSAGTSPDKEPGAGFYEGAPVSFAEAAEAERRSSLYAETAGAVKDPALAGWKAPAGEDPSETAKTPEEVEAPAAAGGKKSGTKPDGPSVRVNFVLSMAYQVLIVILPMITAPYVARVLGADKNGIYSFTASYQTYFSMFAALGTVSYGSREIARNRRDRALRSKLFWEIELMTVLTSSAAILAFIVFILCRDRYQIYYIPQIMAILAVMFDISWFFTGIEEFRYIVTKNAAFKLLGAVLIFTLVHRPEDLLLYIAILSATTMVGNMSMWIHMPKFLDRVDPRTLRIRRHLKETMVYFIPSIATSVYTVLDKTLIGEITRNEAENGCYDKVVQLINIMKALTFTALNSVLGARISFLFAEERYDEIRRRIETSINYILFMGLAIGFGLAGVAPRFIPWFLGPGYERAVMMLILMSPIVVIIGVSNCLGSQYYTPAGKRAQSARFIIAGSCVNLVLNLLLIPRYWGYGAIAASIVAELTITVLYIVFAGDLFHPCVLFLDGWKKLIAAALMFAAVRGIDPLFHRNFPALACEILLGGTVYILVLFVLRDGFMTGFCMDFVRGILHRRRKAQ
ncbi:MAG: oligosaccharide flippase family protein [Lachnospiraceae bacterium]|nr:oligosaccharide flippase family protein [Lachnospiraceae bacterium]